MSIKYKITPLNTADQRRIRGCDDEYLAQLMHAVETDVADILANNCSTTVEVTADELVAPGSKELLPVHIFSCKGEKKFAKVMVVYHFYDTTLDIMIVLYGKPSRNFKKAEKQKFGAKEDEAVAETLFYINTGSAINAVIDRHCE